MRDVAVLRPLAVPKKHQFLQVSGKLLVDMTLSAPYARQVWHRVISTEVEKSLSISSCGTRLQFLGISATRCWENSDPAIAGHFGRHDRAMQHGNISHLDANEVEAFAGEGGGSLAVPRKPSFWRSQGRLLSVGRFLLTLFFAVTAVAQVPDA